jgi:hypothetical protein
VCGTGWPPSHAINHDVFNPAAYQCCPANSELPKLFLEHLSPDHRSFTSGRNIELVPMQDSDPLNSLLLQFIHSLV